MYNNKYSYEVRSSVPRYGVPVKTKVSPLLVVFVVVISLGLMVGCGLLGASMAVNNVKKQRDAQTSTIVYKDNSERIESIAKPGEVMTTAQVVATTKQSVVEITTSTVSYGPFGNNYVQSGAGSGVIVSNDGTIITNYHVIANASPDNVTVTLYDGTSHKVSWIRGDKVSDLAILKINAITDNAVALGDSDKLLQGDDIVAIGNPLGSLGGSVTKGCVSGLDRNVVVDGQNMELIQIDASVNPGNSGGGLFDMYGALVGIVNAKASASDVEGIGFAIPINSAWDVCEDLIQKGYVEGRVNTECVELIEVTSAFGFRQNTGLYVTKDNTGKNLFSSNDYIMSVNGEAVTTKEQWEKVLNSCTAGETVTIVVRRSGADYTIYLTLTQRTDCD